MNQWKGIKWLTRMIKCTPIVLMALFIVFHIKTWISWCFCETFNDMKSHRERTLLTASTRSLEQKKQTHRRTLIILVMKPTWNTGFANSMWPKWPGHSAMLPGQWGHCSKVSLWSKCLLPRLNLLWTIQSVHPQAVPAHVWHRPVRSMTPCLGSIRPPSFGRPPSVVSEYLMPPSVTDILFWKTHHTSHCYDFYCFIKKKKNTDMRQQIARNTWRLLQIYTSRSDSHGNHH